MIFSPPPQKITVAYFTKCLEGKLYTVLKKYSTPRKRQRPSPGRERGLWWTERQAVWREGHSTSLETNGIAGWWTDTGATLMGRNLISSSRRLKDAQTLCTRNSFPRTSASDPKPNPRPSINCNPNPNPNPNPTFSPSPTPSLTLTLTLAVAQA